MGPLVVSRPPPASELLLGFLVAGFVLLVVGLGWLTRRRDAPAPLATPEGTRRALQWGLVYGLCAASFSRVLTPALLGYEQSPWLLALGDVIFVTLGLFVWVMGLAEGRPWRDYGFRGAPPARFALALALGLAAAAIHSYPTYAAIATGQVRVTPDSLVFGLLFAAAGSALPEETLFRGYLQGSLDGRVNRWARLAMPALAFALVRALRFKPGVDLSAGDWLVYVLGEVLPLGLWWGLMRDLGGGSLWPSLVSHFLLEFGGAVAGTSPASATTP